MIPLLYLMFPIYIYITSLVVDEVEIVNKLKHQTFLIENINLRQKFLAVLSGLKHQELPKPAETATRIKNVNIKANNDNKIKPRTVLRYPL